MSEPAHQTGTASKVVHLSPIKDHAT